MRNILITLLSLSLLLGWGWPVRALGQAEADLYPSDASAFPTLSAFLDVFDASSHFVSGLKAGAVTVVEDGKPLPLKDLTEMVVPAEILVAINPGPGLGARDAQGVTRFQRITQALSTWAGALPANTPDDLSLVTIAGPIISHASAKDWLVSLNALQPDFRTTTPNLQSLSIAIDTIVGQTPRVGMKRAVLFITPHMDAVNIDTLVQPLIQRAVQNRVRVFVWFSDSDLYSATASAIAFYNLAMQTGGVLFLATGNPPQFPKPDSYFAPLRRLYSLKYDSAVTTAGAHTFSIEVKTPSGVIKSGNQAFTADIQPPNPMFVAPPLQITRAPPQNDPYNTTILVPSTQKIDIIVEFPDGHKRALVSTTFYVDGQTEAENTSAPFDSFTWDISKYNISGEHKIVVEAVDALGLSKTSIEIPVTLTVIQPPHGAGAVFSKYHQYITLGAVALAGLVLLLIIFMSRLRLMFASAQSAQQMQADPLTQSVAAVAETPVAGIGKKRRAGSSGKTRTRRIDAPAYLHVLSSELLPSPTGLIALNGKEITFGSDPAQSMQLLNDPSIAPSHARIVLNEEGKYLIADTGTIAGTWVNFDPVGKEGHPLQHGDVVHFGQLVFRFELKNPPPTAEPKIVKEIPRS
jgi:FHA domain